MKITRLQRLSDIHARMPIVTVDEQRALQLENATADAGQWAAIRDLNGSPAANREHLVAKVNDAMCPQVLLRV